LIYNDIFVWVACCVVRAWFIPEAPMRLLVLQQKKRRYKCRVNGRLEYARYHTHLLLFLIPF
jgi:hypothetical protein